jgi:hypothetical protein
MKKSIFLLSSAVIIAAKAFSCTIDPTPITISGDDGQGGGAFQARSYTQEESCMSVNGHRMIVWQRDIVNRGSTTTAPDYVPTQESLLQFTFYDPNTMTWTPIVNPTVVPGTYVGYIDPDTTGAGVHQTQLEMCCFDNGTVLAVWQQDIQNPTSGSGPGILTSTYTPGVGWSAPLTLNTSGAQANTPDITCFPNGNAVAIWREIPSGMIEYAYYNGSTWTPGPSPVAFGGASNLRICTNGAGQAIAAWIQGTSVYSANYTYPTSWTTQQLISGTSPIYPQVGIDLGCDINTGNAVVGWGWDFNSPYLGTFYFGANSYNGLSGMWQPTPSGLAGGYLYPPDFAFGAATLDLPNARKTICVGGDGRGHMLLRAFLAGTSPPDNVLLAIDDDGAGNFSAPTVLVNAGGASPPPDLLEFSYPEICCNSCGDAFAIASFGRPIDLTNDPAPINIPAPIAVFFFPYSAQTGQWTTFTTPTYPTLLSTAGYTPWAITVTATPAPTISYFPLGRPYVSCNDRGKVSLVWSEWNNSSEGFVEMKTTQGVCGTLLVPGSLRVKDLKNRFPFQESCFCALEWQVRPCFQGILYVEVYVNGEFVKNVTSYTNRTLLEGICVSGTTITLTPIHILGVPVQSLAYTIP